MSSFQILKLAVDQCFKLGIEVTTVGIQLSV